MSHSSAHSTSSEDTPMDSTSEELAAFTPQTREVDNLFASIRTSLASSSDKAIFTIGGKVEVSKPSSGDSATTAVSASAVHNCLVVRWDSGDQGHGRKTTLPVQDDEVSQAAFAQLVKDCQPATFGRNDQEIFDESYRKAGKLDEDSFCTNFNPYEHGIIDTVVQSLAHADKLSEVNRGIRAELYKLNVYSAHSGKFKSHVDTPRSEQQMGSLVVCLPYSHKGGELVVRHRGQQVTHNWATSSSTQVQWAAFFSDCEHEVLEVTEGHRLTLTYNLYWTPYGPASMANHTGALEEESLPFYSPLQKLLSCREFLPEGGLVGFSCTHAYPHTSNSSVENLHHGLKGIDMVLYQALKRLAGADAVRVSTVLQDGEYLDYVREYNDWSENDSDSCDTSDDGNPLGVEQAFISKKPYPPILHEPLNPYEPKADPQTFIRPVVIDTKIELEHPFTRQKVTWFNHKPGDFDNQELAVAHLTYGNDPGLDSFYSSMVILAKLEGFSSSHSGRKRLEK